MPNPDLENWAAEGRNVVLDLVSMLNISSETYTLNPLQLLPALENYARRLPLDQFEESDWITFQTDLMACLADLLIRLHGAHWDVVEDSRTPRGYRYVVAVYGLGGDVRRIDPVDVVRLELRNLPVDVVRMLASAQKALYLASQSRNSAVLEVGNTATTEGIAQT